MVTMNHAARDLHNDGNDSNAHEQVLLITAMDSSRQVHHCGHRRDQPRAIGFLIVLLCHSMFSLLLSPQRVQTHVCPP